MQQSQNETAAALLRLKALFLGMYSLLETHYLSYIIEIHMWILFYKELALTSYILKMWVQK